MSDRRKSTDSDYSFFGETKREEKRLDETTPAITALIRTQPVLHHRQTPSDREALISSHRTPADSPHKKAILLDSVRSQNYESDFDLDKIDSIRTEKAKQSVETVKRPAIKPIRPIEKAPVKKKERYLPKIPIHKSRKSVLAHRRVKTPMNEIQRRVFSAQQNKFRELQSCLAELQRQLDEERSEARALRKVQRREEIAIKKCQDQEFEAHRLGQGFRNEIDSFQRDIELERREKLKFKQEVESRDQELSEQRHRIKHFEKLVNEDPQIDEKSELEEKLKERKKRLKQIEEKISKEDKKITKLEEKCREEIQDELSKRRDLKHQLERQNKSFDELLNKFEERTRKVGTMHIYIQRGGQRPSTNPSSVKKAHSLQSLHDISPRFREKALDYDKKRRELEKLKPKPKPKPLPAIPQKVERKKYVPKVETTFHLSKTVDKENETKSSVPRESLKRQDKFADSFFESNLSKEKLPGVLKREHHIEEERSNPDDDTAYQSTLAKSPSTVDDGTESQLTQARIHRRPSSPLLAPIEMRLAHSGQQNRRTTSHLPKSLEPLAPAVSETRRQRKFDDKWMDFLKDDDKNDDLLSNIVSHAPKEKKVEKRSSPDLVTFEPSLDNFQRKPEKTFDESQIDFFDPKPKERGPFESTYTKSLTKPTTRDDTFTLSETKIDSIDGLFGPVKRNPERKPLPKIVVNPNKTISNRTHVDEIEDFFA